MNIGDFDKSCLFFGGPYSNLQATEALFNAASDHGIPPERIVCTGDVVAYCGDPQATTDLIRNSAIHVLMGNCEESFGAYALDCGCGFSPGSACDLLAIKWFRYAAMHLSNEAKAWMRGLPRIIYLQMAGRRLAVVHGAVSKINRFIFPGTTVDSKREELDSLKVDGIIGGHSGLPFTQIIDDRLWHNPGVVGMPANDGTSRVWYSIFTPRNGGIEIQHFSLEYDYPNAIRAIRENDLSEGYAVALETGIWPADDIMPKIDQNARGKKIELTPAYWTRDEGAHRSGRSCV